MRAMRMCFPLLALVLLACQGKRAVSPDEENKPGPAPEETTRWEGASSTPEAPRPSSGGGGGVQEAAAKRSDQYDQEATEVVLKRAARQVKENCGAAKDESGKATGPWGKVTIQIQLGHNGHSKGVTVPAPYQGKPSGNCVEKAFTNLTYPPWGGQDTPVDWEVELVQPANEKK
ncbi:MAG: hypothetical protein KF819_27500 [Labilithrix sp.]|nr:hypothetical protein [Labilithrix sp.]